jgi:hypothetical protein
MPATGVVLLGSDNVITIAGRNFIAGQEITISLAGKFSEKVQVNGDGKFSTTVTLPLDLAFGVHDIEVTAMSGSSPIAVASFFKPYSDEDTKKVK